MKKAVVFLKVWIIYAVVYLHAQSSILVGGDTRESVEFSIISGAFFFILLFFDKNEKLLIIPVIMMIMKAFGVSLLTQLIIVAIIICILMMVVFFFFALASWVFASAREEREKWF